LQVVQAADRFAMPRSESTPHAVARRSGAPDCPTHRHHGKTLHEPAGERVEKEARSMNGDDTEAHVELDPNHEDKVVGSATD
jgi:hypothetical protein